MFSAEFAKEKRTQPAPYLPNDSPARQATACSCSSPSANSRLDMPVPSMLGKA